jgi:hypothetical protein
VQSIIQISCYGEAHTIAKNLIKSCIEDNVSCVFGDNHLKIISTVPLSNSTV